MSDNQLTSEQIEKAKKLASGPLGWELSKFPLMFAKGICIGPRPIPPIIPVLNNGTASLIELPDAGTVIITCQHVLEKYRERRKSEKNIIFQIGNVELNPLEILIDEDNSLDIAVLSLNLERFRKAFKDEVIGSNFFTTGKWPPSDVQQEEFISFGGFPGAWRHQPTIQEVVFASYSFGACTVEEVRNNFLQCHIDLVNWQEYFSICFQKDQFHPADITSFGGLSGGPAFILRPSSLSWEFVGIIYEDLDLYGTHLIRIRPGKFIRSDGTINRSMM
jgi:hypothetical protein